MTVIIFLPSFPHSQRKCIWKTGYDWELSLPQSFSFKKLQNVSAQQFSLLRRENCIPYHSDIQIHGLSSLLSERALMPISVHLCAWVSSDNTITNYRAPTGNSDLTYPTLVDVVQMSPVFLISSNSGTTCTDSRVGSVSWHILPISSFFHKNLRVRLHMNLSLPTCLQGQDEKGTLREAHAKPWKHTSNSNLIPPESAHVKKKCVLLIAWYDSWHKQEKGMFLKKEVAVWEFKIT